MISIVTGTPGAGKTYLAVSLILDKYFQKNADEYILKDCFKDYTLFTNIDGLKLPHKSLSEIFEKIPFCQFFSNDYQKKFREKYPKCIYVLDEAQRFIPYGFKDTNVIFYFDYHRHYGDDIVIISQDIKKLCIGITTLLEFEYRAVKPTFQIPGFFIYFLKSGGEVFSRKVVRKRKEVFRLYESFLGPDGKHAVPKSKLIYITLFLILAVVGLIVYFVYDPPLVSASHDRKERKALIMEQQAQQNINQPGQKMTKENFIDPEHVIDKEIIVEITEYLSVSNQLHRFRCPKTKMLISPSQADYRVFSSSGRFFARIPESSLFSSSPSLPPSSPPTAPMSGPPYSQAGKRTGGLLGL